MDESRLKIPLLFGFDVIHGYRTIFPIPLGEASSWDPALARTISAALLPERLTQPACVGRLRRWSTSRAIRVGDESRKAPAKIHISVLPSRARAFADFRERDYSRADKILACAKHWVAYGAAEGGRDYNTTDISENTLREVYFPPFKAAVDAGVGTLMSAFNDLNGVPTSANPFTLTKVLRGEWKFDGFVVSDYTSVKELINHGLAADDKDAARAALNAGVDMEMVSRTFNQQGPATAARRQANAGNDR